GGADDGDEGRLAGVREADDADVGDELQLDDQLALLARFTRLREARRLARGGGEVLVPPSAAPSLSEEHALAVMRKVGDHFVGRLVAHHASDRKLDLDFGTMLARAVRAHPVLPTAALPLALEL